MARRKLDKLLVWLGFLTLIIFIVLLTSFWRDNLRSGTDNKGAVNVSVWSEDTKKVLFLSSYSPDFETFKPQYEGIAAAMEQNNFVLDVFCMNSKKFNTAADEKAFYDYFKASVSTQKPYDAVIVGDDAALLFAMDHQKELFDRIPIVFFGINNEQTARTASENDYIGGYIEPHYLQQTIEMAQKLQPDAQEIICIYDNTETGRADMANYYALELEFPELFFNGLNFQEHTPEETKAILSKLDKSTILLDLSAFVDANGKNYTIPESVRLITTAAGTPVYKDGYGGFGLGIAGGKQHDFYKFGYDAANLAIKMVNNHTLPKDMVIEQSSPGIYRYDYNVFKKFDLDLELIPEDAEIINYPEQEYHQYIWLMGIMFLLTFSVGCFLTYTVINKKRVAEYAKKLKINNDELTELEKKLRDKVDHDEMTGLLTRHACLGLAEQRLAANDEYSVVLVDVDNMKDLNEAYGHDVGDKYLCKVSDNLQKAFAKQNVLIGRYGGDEFLLLFPGRILTEASAEIKKIREIFNQGIAVGTDNILMLMSAGVATSDYSDVRIAVKEADAALDEAKRTGKNQIIFPSEDLIKKFDTYNMVRKTVQDSIADERFYMVYQPQVDCLTQRLVGFEALCRIKEDNTSPAIFIPVAERYGFIKEIGRITTELVVRQLAAWQKDKRELYPVSINLSVYQISDTGYVDFLLNLLKKWQIEPKYIVLEITEGILLERNALSEAMFRRLNEAGIRIHLDDFGTGYSSFGYFSYIQIDAIKIDKSLVNAYLENKDSVIKNLIETIHSMDKKVIVEGVEEECQYQKLKDFNCDIIQGYYFSRPLEVDAATRWLA